MLKKERTRLKGSLSRLFWGSKKGKGGKMGA